jgi:hypothetical protein
MWFKSILVVLFSIYLYTLMYPVMDYSVEIQTDVKNVWAIMSDNDRAKQWVDGFVSMKILSGGKEIKLGGKTEITTVELAGKQGVMNASFVITCTELQEHKLMRYLVEHDLFVQVITYALQSHGSKSTTLRVKSVSYYHSLQEKLLTPLITYITNDKMKTGILNIKKMSEALGK